LADPLRKNAEQIDLTPSQAGVSVKYTVDGVGYDGPAIDGTNGAGAVSLFKQLGGMEVEERRKPQTGTMKVAVDGAKREVKLQTAGTTAGEYLRMMIEPGKRFARSLDQLGLTESQLGMIQSVLRDRSGGVVLVATPKAQGMTSLLYAIMRAHDVYMEHIQSIEREPDQDLEGITQNKLPANASPADESKQVDWVISQEPDVIMINRVEDPRSAASLIRNAGEGKRVYVGLRAGSTAEAVEQWRKLCGDDAGAIDTLKLVIVGRVLRKLCMACKESYAPDPNTLKKLNLNPEKVTTLFKARESQLRDPKGNPIPCTFCHDLRFQGRTGVFELLIVDDDVREALRRDFAASGRPSSQFKAAFRKKGLRYLQEEALALVERGDTSVQEVLRVLRGPDEGQPPRKSPSSPAAAAARPRPPAAQPS
jgi:type II secretory ATPase GspE/PulE/Tfp pilus assembly ATPase PilB-like protein